MRKKKILVIGMTEIVGGVETFIKNVYINFDYENYEVDFLHHSREGIVFEREFRKNKSHIYYCEKFLRHPIKSHRQLKEIYKSREYDVIHCNACSTNMMVYFLPALGLKKRPLIVMHSHSSASENRNRKIRHFFLRPILNRCVDRRLACSDKAGIWMYGKKQCFQIIPNGVKVDDFLFDETLRKKIRKKHGYSDEDIIIGSVGRLEAVKNHQFFIDVMKKLDMKYKYMIIGDGRLRNQLQNRVKNNGLLDRIKILHSTQKINEYYQAFDLYVSPSKFEGLPMTCVEAQLSGLPMLLSDEISKDAGLSSNVLFLSIQSYEEWINEILKMKLNLNRRNINPDLARKFDCRNTAKQLCELFNEAFD